MPETPIQREIRWRMNAAGYNQKSLARAAGLNQTAVRDILKGRSRNPRADTLEALARVLDCTLDELTGSVTAVEIEESPRAVQVIGRAEAGRWVKQLESPLWDHYTVVPPPAMRLEGAPRFGIEVHDVSFNKVYNERDVLICVWVDDAERGPKSGDKVLMSRHDNEGRIEVSIREYQVDSYGTAWLWPRSTEPEYQQPVRFTPAAQSCAQATEKQGAKAGQEAGGDPKIMAIVIGSFRHE